ncbi:MAG: TRAP transporter small permease [Rhodospirillales bacterium]|nr:TRAP transporter small permease [Rhodospirillales bacterium]
MKNFQRILDKVYSVSSTLAAFCTAMIGLLIFSEIVLRFFGTTIPGVIELVVFCMVASVFLALAQTLRKNEHIRITVVISHLPPKIRRWIEIWCLSVSALFFGTLAFFSIIMAYESFIFNEMSDGVVGIPLWIPQLFMFWGVTLITITFIENFFITIKGGMPVYVTDAAENPEIDDIIHEEAAADGAHNPEKGA